MILKFQCPHTQYSTKDAFWFVHLQERKPELTSEIMAFRDYLLSSTVSDTLDVWELKGIYNLWFSFC